jgi:DinB superfamily
MFSAESFVYAWDNQLRYALALLADVADEQMVLRPGGNMNHPAWIIGHVSLYHPAAVALLRGEPFDDPKDNRLFGFAGQGPVDDIAVYGGKQALFDRFTAGHEQVAQALLSAEPADFKRPPSLARWAAQYPTVEFMLPDLLVFHESMHIGQISTWRGRPAGGAIPRSHAAPRPAVSSAPVFRLPTCDRLDRCHIHGAHRIEPAAA